MMAIWIADQDPVDQVLSRTIPLNSGVIGERTRVQIPASLNSKRTAANLDAQRIFDLLAMRIAQIFPFWKGTRVDFRFANNEEVRVLALTPKKRFIRVDIRIDITGYQNRNNLFTDAPAASSAYPGEWIRANVDDINMAIAIAEDIMNDIG